jgi:hypothetical protein
MDFCVDEVFEFGNIFLGFLSRLTFQPGAPWRLNDDGVAHRRLQMIDT